VRPRAGFDSEESNIDITASRKQYSRALSVIAAGILWVLPNEVFACSCAPGSVSERLANSDFVFTGYISTEPRRQVGRSVVYTFNQLDILKGDSRATVDITLDSMNESMCGYTFAPDVKYRVYASEQNGDLHSSLCSLELVPVGVKAVPLEESLKNNNIEYRLNTSPEIKSVTGALIQAGCEVLYQSTGMLNCFRETDASPLVCKGHYTSVFAAVDGSYDQHYHTIVWNRRTDELQVTGYSGLPIMPTECSYGMDGELRHKTGGARQ